MLELATLGTDLDIINLHGSIPSKVAVGDTIYIIEEQLKEWSRSNAFATKFDLEVEEYVQPPKKILVICAYMVELAIDKKVWLSCLFGGEKLGNRPPRGEISFMIFFALFNF
ncbi:hypothetical protein FRX31_031150 [Thalictrum thalictroides]|uniref:Uncharacterized protein n=1 Tax=Thalictrum thalictroides TaxID=46969 RepID=A0A7J6V2Y8_THATH|nr:hypothetical protein FRX31_031150 [Thalictrum thalictroides]